MAELDLSAAADVLGRAADRLEKLAVDANGGEPPEDRWVADRSRVRWAETGTATGYFTMAPVAENCTPAEAEFIAAVDPHAVAALVPALRLAAGNLHDKDWHFVKVGEAVRCCDCEEHAALLSFARRVLREEGP